PAHSACVSRVRLGKSAENRTDFLSLPSSLSERLGRIHAPVLPHCFAERHSPAAGHATWTLPTDLRWPVRGGGWLTLHAVFLARAPATPSATLPPSARAAGPDSGASPSAEGAAVVRLERAPPNRRCHACRQRPRTAVTEGHQDRRARWRRGQVPVARRGV